MKTLVKKVDGFDIYFKALEDSDYNFDMMEDSDVQETKDSIESGELVLFCAKVSAVKAGIELASDYLGGCIYESEEDFYTKYENEYFADMIQNVLAEAKETIKELNKVEDVVFESEYTEQDDIWPSRKWNKERTDYIDLSGTI